MFPVAILEFKSRKRDLLHLSQCSVGKLKAVLHNVIFLETCNYTFERCKLVESFRNCIYIETKHPQSVVNTSFVVAKLTPERKIALCN